MFLLENLTKHMTMLASRFLMLIRKILMVRISEISIKIFVMMSLA